MALLTMVLLNMALLTARRCHLCSKARQPIMQRPDLGAENMPILSGQRQVVDLMCEQVALQPGRV